MTREEGLGGREVCLRVSVRSTTVTSEDTESGECLGSRTDPGVHFQRKT